MSLKDFLTQTVQIGAMTPRTGEGVKTYTFTSYPARLDQPGSTAKMNDWLFGAPEANLFLDGSTVIDVQADDVVRHGTKQYVVLKVRDMRDQVNLRHYEVALTTQEFVLASILRYVESGGKPQAGIPPTKDLVTGFADLNCFVQRMSSREVMASKELYELTDLKFVFYTRLYETDEILCEGKTYKIIQIQYYDPAKGKSVVVART